MSINPENKNYIGKATERVEGVSTILATVPERRKWLNQNLFLAERFIEKWQKKKTALPG